MKKLKYKNENKILIKILNFSRLLKTKIRIIYEFTSLLKIKIIKILEIIKKIFWYIFCAIFS